MEVTDAMEQTIAESSQVGEALRNIITLAHAQGFSEPEEARLKLICSELATNLLKHTKGGGKLLAQAVTNQDDVGVEIFSVDQGPGMIVEECVTDGFSSSGTMGTGLGAVQRNSDLLNIYSEVHKGSILQARVWNGARRVKYPKDQENNLSHKSDPTSQRCYAGLTVPKPGELVSGDKWCIIDSGSTINCLVVDGLGHGVEADEAARLAVRRFKENVPKPPSAVLSSIHTSLRGSRGAVGAIAQIDKANRKLHFCGLGNISALLTDENIRKHLTSFNGTLGYEARRFHEFSHPWRDDSVLLMHSDGLSSKTFEDVYTIQKQPAPIIAAWLYSKYSKGSDDSTILVCKGSDAK